MEMLSTTLGAEAELCTDALRIVKAGIKNAFRYARWALMKFKRQPTTLLYLSLPWQRELYFRI